MDEKEDVSKHNEGKGGTNQGKKGSWILRLIKNNLSRKAKYIIIAVILGVFVLGGLKIGYGTFFDTDSKSTKLRFEDIGELATQAAYCTNISVEDKSRTLFGATIPFTQSKNIFTFDTIIKAGINFEDIDCDVDGVSKVVKVGLPEVKILSNEVDYESLKVYLEDESIFTPIKLSEHNEAMIELKETAEQDAIANGLLEDAKENAKLLLTGYIAGVVDLDEYTIEFIDL